MSRALHTTHYKVRHRVTGLFAQTGRSPTGERGKVVSWKPRGQLFRSKRALRKFLDGQPEIPREWQVVPIELVQRDDRISAARQFYDVFLMKLKERRKRTWGARVSSGGPGHSSSP